MNLDLHLSDKTLFLSVYTTLRPTLSMGRIEVAGSRWKWSSGNSAPGVADLISLMVRSHNNAK
jgi:hypothetical protein